MLGIFQHVWLTNFPAVCPRTHLVLRVRGRRTDLQPGAALSVRIPPGAVRPLLDAAP